jgi:hypothetical protein
VLDDRAHARAGSNTFDHGLSFRRVWVFMPCG